MKNLGKGAILKDAFPRFRNDELRIEQILTVAETDSIIEGLPPFDEDIRNRLRRQLKDHDELCPAPAERS
jgi:hypothetical protein